MAKDLSSLYISSSFQRLLQVDPDDNHTIIDGDGDNTSLKVSGSLTVTDTIFAERMRVSHSIVFTSGSTIFGDVQSDTHEFTGSITVTGSVTADSFSGDGSGLTGVTGAEWDGTRDGNASISGSLIVSGSDPIAGQGIHVGHYFVNGGTASTSEEIYVSGSGIQRAIIESSDNSTVLQLKAPTGQSTIIDFEEGGNQRWTIGSYGTNDNFVISSGSALSSGPLLQVNRTSKDVIVSNNISASGALIQGNISASGHLIINNITASGNISGSATSTLSIGGASTLAGNNTLGTNGAGTSHNIYGNSTFTDNLQINGVFTANGNSILGNASSDKIKIFGDSTITGSLIVSGSTTSTIDIARLRVGDYFVNGGAAVSSGEEVYISGSGIARVNIESSDSEAVLRIKSDAGASSIIDFEEGGDQRWTLGSHSNNDFIISSGSSLAGGTLVTIDRTTKDVEIINNISASAVSASTYFGDGSNLTGISSVTNLTGLTDAEIVASSGGSALQYNIFLTNGSSAGASPSHGTLSDARANIALGPNALASLTQGDFNIGIGYQTLDSLTIGHQNIAIGYAAGQSLIDTSANVFIGYAAGHVSTSTGTVAIGYDALRSGVHSGVDCVVIGKNAGYTMAAANDNTLIGMDAGKLVSSGDGNTTLGFESGDTISTGNYNTIIGASADGVATVDNQIAIGRSVTTTGAGDIKIGDGNAGVIPFSGSAVTGDVIFPSTASAAYFSGDGSKLTNTPSPFPFTGDAVITGSLTISGSQAFKLDATNVVLGKNAGGGSVDTGTDDNNVIIGTDAVGGGSFNSGDGNIAIGHSAAEGLTTGDENIAIGTNAAGGGALSGVKNVVIGSNAGLNLGSTADFNVLIGENAGATLANGNQNNVMIGRFAGNSAPAGTYNTVLVGNNAGRAISGDSDGAVLIGSWAGVGASGASNIAIGMNAIRGGNDSFFSSNTDIIKNIAIGDGAGRYIDGHQNIFIGHDVAGSTSLGAAHNNTIIGFEAAASLTTGEGNIIIGPSVDVNGATADHHLRIGSGSLIAISASLSTGDVLFPGNITALKGAAATHLLGTTSGATSLTLRSGNTSNVFLDFEEGTNNRYVVGVHGSTDEFRICNNTSSPNSNIAISVGLTSGDTTIHNQLLMSGSITYQSASVVTVDHASHYQIGSGEHLVRVKAAGGAVQMTLPSASAYPGRQIFFKVVDAPGSNTIGISGSAVETIDGAFTTAILNEQWEGISLVSDASASWHIF